MKFNFKLEDIKYVKILYKDKSSTPCITKAGLKKIDEREIFACGKFEDGLEIDTPQEITLSFICNDGLYRTKTILKSVENDEPYTFFTLNTPQGIEYEQNREYFRVLAKYDCIYKVLVDGVAVEYNSKTVDISANGVSILLPKHIISERNSELYIIINNKPFRTKIKFVRSEKVNEGYKISFTYVDISEQDRDFISQICLKKQLEQRRNSIV